MYVDLTSATGTNVKLWLEVDLGSEGQRQIRSKLERYWRAFSEADERSWPVWPLIAWVSIDDWRAKELRWIISQTSEEAQKLFRVLTIDELVRSFAKG
jgi:hypothetical protein